MRLVIATTNKGKIKEIEQVLATLAVTVESFNAQTLPLVVEDGETFAENACKKARHYALHTGCFALADDSGLEVDALQGRPGVHSARYAGEHAGDEENNQKLLKALQAVPWEQRTARFRCVVAIATPQGEVWTAKGSCEGTITTQCSGQGGFGYDPVFLVEGTGKTMAELPEDEKNKISHRAMAFAKALPILKEILKGAKV
ncbi:MAG TPA: non-canonical purine NTP pyrophosphatase [Firmicutes bacterium]|nr:non-canonical purine NTP pyrophosphatase [Bacillota bacterium]